MESYLKENFGGVQPKHSSEEALGRWRKVVGVVKNPKRRFRFTANLDKRSEVTAMKRKNHVSNKGCCSSHPHEALNLILAQCVSPASAFAAHCNFCVRVFRIVLHANASVFFRNCFLSVIKK
jgi:hypothetical protein